MANLEKVIIISDHDIGFLRTIYKDGKIYGKSRLMVEAGRPEWTSDKKKAEGQNA